MRSPWGAIVVMVVACRGASSTVRTPHSEPTVTVLDPGALPRQRLRYELAPNLSERVELTQKLIQATTYTNTVLETGSRKGELPTIRMIGQLGVTGATPGGDTLLGFLIDDVEVDKDADPTVRAQLQSALQTATGAHGSWRVSPTGRVADVVFVAAENVGRESGTRVDSLGDSVQGTWVEFPDGDVGIGAAWTVTSQQRRSGIVWERTVTYKLLSLVDSIATVDVHVAMKAGSQPLTVEPNQSIRLTSGTSTSSAQVIVPLHGIVATATTRESTQTSYLIVQGRNRITSTVNAEEVHSINPVRDQGSSNSAPTGK